LALYILINTFTYWLNFGSGLIRAAQPLLRARSVLLNLYLRLLTFCSVELSPISGPCCLLDSHTLSTANHILAGITPPPLSLYQYCHTTGNRAGSRTGSRAGVIAGSRAGVIAGYRTGS
jgi:hypothetical protein